MQLIPTNCDAPRSVCFKNFGKVRRLGAAISVQKWKRITLTELHGGISRCQAANNRGTDETSSDLSATKDSAVRGFCTFAGSKIDIGTASSGVLAGFAQAGKENITLAHCSSNITVRRVCRALSKVDVLDYAVVICGARKNTGNRIWPPVIWQRFTRGHSDFSLTNWSAIAGATLAEYWRKTFPSRLLSIVGIVCPRENARGATNVLTESSKELETETSMSMLQRKERSPTSF